MALDVIVVAPGFQGYISNAARWAFAIAVSQLMMRLLPGLRGRTCWRAFSATEIRRILRRSESLAPRVASAARKVELLKERSESSKRVRMCAKKVVAACAAARSCPTSVRRIRVSSRQHSDINQLEGLAVAIPWGFESPLPHHSTRLPARLRRAERLAHGEPSIMSNVLSEHLGGRRLAKCESKDRPKAGRLRVEGLARITTTMASSSRDALRLLATLCRQQPLRGRDFKPADTRA